MANSTFPKAFRVVPKIGMGHLADAIRKGIIPWAWDGGRFLWQQKVKIEVVGGVARVGEVALEADGSTEVDLHVAFPNNMFPADVDIQRGAGFRRLTTFSGGAINAATITVGDTGAANGLITSSNVFTGQTTGRHTIRTSGAAQYDLHSELDFVPVIVIATTNGNGADLEQGEVDIVIPFLPLAEDLAA